VRFVHTSRQSVSETANDACYFAALINTHSVLEILRQSAESLRRDRISADNAAGLGIFLSFVRYATEVKAKGSVEAKLSRHCRERFMSDQQVKTIHNTIKRNLRKTDGVQERESENMQLSGCPRNDCSSYCSFRVQYPTAVYPIPLVP
jgi:hypothetical protein